MSLSPQTLISSIKERIQKRDNAPQLIIILLGLIAWLNPSSFIWRDEWTYLSYFYQKKFDFFNGNLAFEIKPLFQYVLFTEFYLGGIHFDFYQAINALLLIIIGLIAFRILKLFQLNSVIALIASLLLLLHPVNFVNAFWIFQQCELIHLTCLLMCFYLFEKYLQEKASSMLLTFLFLLLVQNYFFPNGIFFPILFILLYLMSNKDQKLDFNFIALTFLVFIAHLLHALYINSKMEGGEGFLSHLGEKIVYFFHLVSISFWRVGIPNLQPGMNPIIHFITILLLLIFFVITFKKLKENSRRLLVMSVLAIIFSSIILVLTRFKQPEIHYYYTALHMPYIFFIVGIYGDHYINPEKRIIKLGTIAVILVLLLIDFKGRRIFSSRNEANKEQMEAALQTNSYAPFDDPFFLPGDYRFLNLGDYKEPEAAVVLYKFLKDE